MRRISQMLREIPLEELTGEDPTETDIEIKSSNKSKAYIKSKFPSFAFSAAVILVAVCAAVMFIGGGSILSMPGSKQEYSESFELLKNDIKDNYDKFGTHCPITLPIGLYTYSLSGNELDKEECYALGKDIASAFTGKDVGNDASEQNDFANGADMSFNDSEKGRYSVAVYSNGVFNLMVENVNYANTGDYSSTNVYRFMPNGESLGENNDLQYITDVANIPTNAGGSCSPEEALETANGFINALTDRHDFLPLDDSSIVSFVPVQIDVHTLYSDSPNAYSYDISYAVEINGTRIDDMSFYSVLAYNGAPIRTFSASITVRVDSEGEIYSVSGRTEGISKISSGEPVKDPITLSTILDKVNLIESDIIEITVVLSYNTDPNSPSQSSNVKLAPYWRIRLGPDPSAVANMNHYNDGQSLAEQFLYVNMISGEGIMLNTGTGEYTKYNLN